MTRTFVFLVLACVVTERIFCILCALSLFALGWLAGALCAYAQVLREVRRR